MKITSIRATPLYCRFRQPYHWSQGVNYGAPIILIEIETDAGIVGIAESVASPDIEPVLAIINFAIPVFVGESAYDGARLIAKVYQAGFNARGTGSAPRYFAQAISGIELALWDAIGKAAKQPVHRLLGGAIHQAIHYFAFVQGDTPEELAGHAARLIGDGFAVVYLKVGRGMELDLAIVQSVREAIGNARLRLDANEVWDMLTARTMFAKLERFDIEFIEQPVPARAGSAALAKLRASTNIPIAADQTVYGPDDVYDICRSDAADVITLGMHETGGLQRYRKAAAVAEAAGLNVCIHGVFETGITTCATNQVAATIPNMDDGNQIMWQLLERDIVRSPSLAPVDGALPISQLPGLGFELDPDAVKEAADAFRKQR
jgi:L-alanine-DL-glutamate epimerase-like enolase superfamily enzyme